MLQIIDSMLFLSKGTWGEDRIFSGSNFCGVIDSSTPIDKVPINGCHTQAEWFAEFIKNYLEGLRHIEDFHKECIKGTNKIKNSKEINLIAETYNLPVATIAAVVESDGLLKGYVLGDCAILFKLKNGEIKILTDKRISNFSKLTIEAKKEAILNSQNAKTAVRNQMIKNRKMMNTENGFWTLATTGDYAKEFQTIALSTEDVERCLIYTDGLNQICEMNNIKERDLLTESDISAIVRKLLKTTKQDINNTHHVKAIDDIGFILTKNCT